MSHFCIPLPHHMVSTQRHENPHYCHLSRAQRWAPGHGKLSQSRKSSASLLASNSVSPSLCQDDLFCNLKDIHSYLVSRKHTPFLIVITMFLGEPQLFRSTRFYQRWMLQLVGIVGCWPVKLSWRSVICRAPLGDFGLLCALPLVSAKSQPDARELEA